MALKPTPRQEDARLHDVQLLGNFAWAVGDQGVVWRSVDGGRTWELAASGVTSPLRSVCFLTDQIGWVAGGETSPFTGQSAGVLLATTDGGKTWTPVTPPGRNFPPASDRGLEQRSKARLQPSGAWPRLHRVKFFSLEEGFIVGDSDSKHPTGVMFRTESGWEELPGTAVGNWRAADFAAMELGAVAGLRGASAVIANGKLLPARNALPELASYGAMALHPSGHAWLVGEGGTVLRSDNMGVVWESPAGALPESLPETSDFHAVCCREEQAWIGGSPGSIIWHTPNGGKTWIKQKTGQSLPLSSISFTTDTDGLAVGALGTILLTENGGKTWSVVCGQNRRLALLGLFTTPSQISLPLVTQLAGEDGYRCGMLAMTRDDVGPEGRGLPDVDARLQEAVQSIGGSEASIDWQFPLLVPGLKSDREKLVADWNLRTEGRLSEILVGRLVRHLRTWHPSVVVVDQPTDADAVALVLNQATLLAVAKAADPTQFPEQLADAGLKPWQAERVCVRLPNGSRGPITLDPHRYLPFSGQSLEMAVSAAQARLSLETPDGNAGLSLTATPLGHRESFRVDWTRTGGQKDAEATAYQDFFSGISIQPGTEARRAYPPLDETLLTKRADIAKRQRNFAGIVQTFLTDGRQSANMLAQLGEVTRNMPEDQAALQMARLAESQLAIGQWELAELTMLELVARYPQEPVAIRAAWRLTQFWGGVETSWRRLQLSTIRHSQMQPTGESTVQAMQSLLSQLNAQDQQLQKEGLPFGLPALDSESPAKIQQASAKTGSLTSRGQLSAKFNYWQGQSVKMAKDLEIRAPGLFADAETQFALAAVFRGRGAPDKANEVYREFAKDPQHRWHRAATGELWATAPNGPPDRALCTCNYTAIRPVLDGLLSDQCWQNAEELPLLESSDSTKVENHAFVMFCSDQEYLYLAARMPRHPAVRTDRPLKTGRKHDDNLNDFDRFTFMLDVDRDYATWYRFSVDQRGCTAEDCWGDTSWNPKWFVAADGDEGHWRIEAAIRLDELVPVAPVEGALWNLGVTRTIPAAAVQSWTQPAHTAPHPETFGLLRFK